MRVIYNMVMGAGYAYVLIAFCVGSAALIDLLFKVVPAVCK